MVYLAHLKALDEKLNLGRDGRRKLLTLWSNLATAGKNPLYDQVFLNRSVLKPVRQSVCDFGDPLGRHLQYFDEETGKYKPFYWDPEQQEDPTTGNLSLKSHLAEIQVALTLTSEEIYRILAEANGKTFEEATATGQGATYAR